MENWFLRKNLHIVINTASDRLLVLDKHLEWVIELPSRGVALVNR